MIILVRSHVFISGKVQGVFFRHSSVEKAKNLGVFGWVKNLSDKRVEMLLEGERQKIEKMLEWAKRGPRFARVENIIVIEENFIGEFQDFKQA